MKYNIWNKWDPLKVCMLGNNYAPEFFNGVNDKVASPLKRICEETLEDLEGYKTILQDFGVEVIQPELDPNERFLDNPHRYPRGPLQPRDNQLVIANECYATTQDHPSIIQCLKDYSDVVISDYDVNYPMPLSENYYKTIAGADYPSYDQFLKNRKNKEFFEDHVWQELVYQFRIRPMISSAYVFPIGKSLIVGSLSITEDVSKEEHIYQIPSFGKFNCVFTPVDGHTDGNFHPIKPGAILSLNDVQNYAETFPGWEVCYLPDQSWEKVKPFVKLKWENGGKWWLAGEEDNAEFTNFVETWLQDWVGYVEETVFDVNVLMLDEHHCCVSNPNNAEVNAFLKKHKVEPVYVPWRHRYFWDGGLHCITLDLYREGTQKDYFG